MLGAIDCTSLLRKQKFTANVVVGLLGNKSPDSNRFTLVTPKSENDVRLQATLGNQNHTGLPVGAVRKNSFDIPTAKLFKRQINDELARAHVTASVSSVKMCFEEQNGELYAGFRFSLAEGRNTEKFRNVVEDYIDGQILDGFGESMFAGKAEDGKPFYFCFS